MKHEVNLSQTKENRFDVKNFSFKCRFSRFLCDISHLKVIEKFVCSFYNTYPIATYVEIIFISGFST